MPVCCQELALPKMGINVTGVVFDKNIFKGRQECDIPIYKPGLEYMVNKECRCELSALHHQSGYSFMALINNGGVNRLQRLESRPKKEVRVSNKYS